MEFRILGPLDVLVRGQRVRLGRSREQKVLAALLVDAGRVVPLDRLVDAVWDDRPPDTAAKLVRNCVSTLRQLLAGAGAPGELIATEPAGYALRIGADQLDAELFRRQVDEARRLAAAGRLESAVELMRAALALWRGPALAGLGGRLIEAAATGLNEQRLTVLEECVAHELALGKGHELVGELAALVAEQPLRERLRGQLMLALYRAGRRTEALAAYRQGRRFLVQELGIEPGPELQELEQAILRDDGQLAASPAPRKGGWAAPAQLPADVPAFTGRSRYLGELDVLLAERPGDRARAVVISAIAGTAGVGKTALAVHWAHRIRTRFGDGQLFVNLRGYAPNPPMRTIDALALFLRALGVPAERVPVDVEEAAGLYRSLLADRRVLVVLDNAASPEQVRPLLPGSSGCLVVVTSRDALGGLVAKEGARRLRLDALTPAEAHTLLARILGDAWVADEPDAASELAEMCAYLPLALRIAAANLTSRDDRSIAGYLAELRAGDRVADLAVEGDAEAAVRAAFDLSYAALPPETRLTFRRMGLAPGPDLTADAVAALTAATPREAAQGLDRLAAAHLVDEHTAGRFTFHDLLRRYAAERAHAEEPEDEVRAATRRLQDWYLRSADAAARLVYPEILRLPAPRDEAAPAAIFDGLAWLDSERTNLVAAVVHAAENGPRPVASLLADALRGYFHLRMHTADWLAVGHAALTAAELDGDRTAQAAACLSLGDAHWRLSRYPQAIEHYARAADLAAQSGWLLGRVAVHGNLGNVYQQAGELAKAAEQYHEALATAEEGGWVAGQAANLENLGAVYWELGRLAEAADHSTRALAIYRETESRFGQAVDLTGLGEVCHALGRYDEAAGHLNRALSLHREVGNRGGEAETLRVLALLHRDTGHHDRALDLARTSLELARDAGDRRYEADALNTVATVQLLLGQVTDAVEGHQAALALAREIGNRYPETEALIGLATAHRHLGDPDRAVAYARDGLAVARQVGYSLLEGQALAALTDIEGSRPTPGSRYG